MKKIMKWTLVIAVISVLSWDIVGFAAVYFSDETAQRHLGSNPQKKPTLSVATTQGNTATQKVTQRKGQVYAAAERQNTQRQKQLAQTLNNAVEARGLDFPVLKLNGKTMNILAAIKDSNYYIYTYEFDADEDDASIIAIYAHSTLPEEAAKRQYLDGLTDTLRIEVYRGTDLPPTKIHSIISEQDQNYLRIIWSDGEFCEGAVVKKNTRPRLWAYINYAQRDGKSCSIEREMKRLRTLVIPDQVKFPKKEY